MTIDVSVFGSVLAKLTAIQAELSSLDVDVSNMPTDFPSAGTVTAIGAVTTALGNILTALDDGTPIPSASITALATAISAALEAQTQPVSDSTSYTYLGALQLILATLSTQGGDSRFATVSANGNNDGSTHSLSQDGRTFTVIGSNPQVGIVSAVPFYPPTTPTSSMVRFRFHITWNGQGSYSAGNIVAGFGPGTPPNFPDFFENPNYVGINYDTYDSGLTVGRSQGGTKSIAYSGYTGYQALGGAGQDFVLYYNFATGDMACIGPDGTQYTDLEATIGAYGGSVLYPFVYVDSDGSGNPTLTFEALPGLPSGWSDPSGWSGAIDAFLPFGATAESIKTLAQNLPAQGPAAASASTPVTIATNDAQLGTDATGVSQLAGGSGIRGWLSGAFSYLATLAGTVSGGKVQVVPTLATGAAQDGTDATDVSQLTGGVGIRGWLSGIFSKISGLIGSAGSASANVLSVQGIASGTALTVQPVASVSIAGTLTNTSSVVALSTPLGMQSILVQATGTFSGLTAPIQFTADGTNWDTLNLSPVSSGGGTVPTSSILATGAYCNALPSGTQQVRVTCSSISSGTVNIFLQASATPFVPALQFISTLTGQIGINSTVSSGIIPLTGTASDAQSISTSALNIAQLMQYNGASWDRWRNNASGTITASGAITASAGSTSQTNYNAKGVSVFCNVTAVSGTSPTMTLQLQYQDPVSGNWVNIPGAVTTTINATGQYSLTCYPGATVSTSSPTWAGSAPLPRTWRVYSTLGGTTPSFTCSLSYNYIL